MHQTSLNLPVEKDTVIKMKNFFALLLRSALFIISLPACNNSNDHAKNNDTIKDYTSKSDPAESVSTCYENINGKDTVALSLFSESKVITGSLIYNYYGKDKNNGTVRGYMYGDTLIADYIFMSEGKTSERQVAFLKKDRSFIEGYGDVEELDGRTVFKNRSSLNFTGSPLHQVSCSQ